jgi:CBS domain-containing protein
VLFFIMAGAALHLQSLSHMGIIGAAYVAMRFGGKFFGCRLGALWAGDSQIIKTWLGPAMLTQAGLAIGLAEVLARQWPGSGITIQTVVLASVVVFEVLGPIVTRTALVNAGEVTVLHLISQRSRVGIGEGLAQVFNELKKALGISTSAGRRGPEGVLVGHIMRRNVEVISNRAPFDEVLKALGHSRYDRLPVVNDKNELVGVVRYADIANTLFEPNLRDLVVADDIATQVGLMLTPEDSLEKAMIALKNYPDDAYLLVTEQRNPKVLVGIVRHNDLLSAHIRALK